MSINKREYFLEGCGIKPTRIVGGSEAEPYSIPWQVGLLHWGYTYPHCGGTLISNRHVLTAAHCTNSISSSYNSIVVVVGDHKIIDNFHGFNLDGTFHTICRIQNHPQYNNETFNNDFAIITLTRPVEIGIRVNYACLPTSALEGDFLAGKTVELSGWGQLGSDLPWNQSWPWVLHTVDLPVVSTADCKLWFPIPEPPNTFPITDRMLCAGREGETAVGGCIGDSGGNNRFRNNRQTIIG